MTGRLSIGEVARRVGCSVHTLRRLEKRGLYTFERGRGGQRWAAPSELPALAGLVGSQRREKPPAEGMDKLAPASAHVVKVGGGGRLAALKRYGLECLRLGHPRFRAWLVGDLDEWVTEQNVPGWLPESEQRRVVHARVVDLFLGVPGGTEPYEGRLSLGERQEWCGCLEVEPFDDPGTGVLHGKWPSCVRCSSVRWEASRLNG